MLTLPTLACAVRVLYDRIVLIHYRLVGGKHTNKTYCKVNNGQRLLYLFLRATIKGTLRVTIVPSFYPPNETKILHENP